jgi:endonuclease YncB( thermonuclease family)
VLDAAHEQHKILLAGIDAPERSLPFGKKATKDYLTGLVAGKDVRVDGSKRDRYKRIVGRIIHDERDVNLEMVRSGYAHRWTWAVCWASARARFVVGKRIARK